MQMKTKLPEGLTGIAEIMEMNKEEVQAWEFFKEVRQLFKDYNFKVLTKDSLIAKLYDISCKCANKQIYHYSTGIDNAVLAIKTCY